MTFQAWVCPISNRALPPNSSLLSVATDKVISIWLDTNTCSHCMYTHTHTLCVCVFVSSCQATIVVISKYLPTSKVVVSVGGVNRSELLTSLIHVP